MNEIVSCDGKCGTSAQIWVDLGQFVVGWITGRAHLCLACAVDILPQTAGGYVETPLNERRSEKPLLLVKAEYEPREFDGDRWFPASSMHQDADGNVLIWTGTGTAKRQRITMVDGREWKG